jgi:hypothetical protein
MSNSGLEIRHKLYDFIQIADEKKLKTIYHLLQDEIEGTKEWWKDKGFIAELDHRYRSIENGTDKGYTLDKLETSINKLRKKSRI